MPVFNKYETKGRFYVQQKSKKQWLLIDRYDNTQLLFTSKSAADKAYVFAVKYVEQHGDIDLTVFPKTLDDPYQFRMYAGRPFRPWWVGDQLGLNKPGQ